MKKYVKPELFYERYELSQHVAACTWDLNQTNENICNFKGDDAGFAGHTLLMHERGCTYEGPYCYMASTSGENTFMS